LRRDGAQAIRCLSHGDLHAGNIMVASNGGEVRVIDPAELGMHFWASDLARLLVDLIVTCWDHVVDSSLLKPAGEEYRESRMVRPYDWKAFSQWRRLCATVSSGSTAEIEAFAIGEYVYADCPPNRGMLFAILWIRKSLASVHGAGRVGLGPGPGW